MEFGNVRLDDPDPAGRRPADQDEVPVHPPEGLAQRPAGQLPGHAGQRVVARRLPLRPFQPHRIGTDLERPALFEPTRTLRGIPAVRAGPAPEVDAEEVAVDELDIGVAPADLPVVDHEVGVGPPADEQERLPEHPRLRLPLVLQPDADPERLVGSAGREEEVER